MSDCKVRSWWQNTQGNFSMRWTRTISTVSREIAFHMFGAGVKQDPRCQHSMGQKEWFGVRLKGWPHQRQNLKANSRRNWIFPKVEKPIIIQMAFKWVTKVARRALGSTLIKPAFSQIRTVILSPGNSFTYFLFFFFSFSKRYCS